MKVTFGDETLIPVADIHLEETTQIREQTYPETVTEYRAAMQAYDPEDGDTVIGFPPIKVHEQNGVFIVIDGWHRVTAARGLGKRFIEAVVVEMDTPGDPDEMRWLAIKANLTPGLRLTKAEKQEALRLYLKALQHRHMGPRGGRANGPFKTLREIGRDLGGMHHMTISRFLEKHAPNTLKAILAADPKGAVEPDGSFEQELDKEALIDKARRKKARGAIEELNRLIRLIKSPEALRAIKEDMRWVARELNKKGA